MAETQSYNVAELFTSLPKCVFASAKFDDSGSIRDEPQNFTNEEFNLIQTESRLLESIVGDDSSELIDQLKRFKQKALIQDEIEGDQWSDPTEVLDRGIVSKLFRVCCALDSVNCASALLKGAARTVPLINEMDDTGWSALHKAADRHAKKCIELLLRKRARTDIKSKAKHAQLPLELALCSLRMDVIWNSDDSVEDLLVCLSEKDLMPVKLLAEKTKDIAEVAYVCAIKCRVVSLAALLIVDAERVNDSISVLQPDADSGSKEKTSAYDCVIREALLLDQKNGKQSPNWSKSENAERRKLLLCEIELLQLFGAVAQRSACTEQKTPLILASQASDEAVIVLLLKTKIDVNDADAEGNSALHWSLKTYKDHYPQHMSVTIQLRTSDANGNSFPLLPLSSRQRPIDLAKSRDMRYILSPTNIRFASRAFRRKYTAWLPDDQLISETCEEILPIKIKGTSTKSLLTEHSRSYGSPGGSLTRTKCYYAPSKENPWQAKQDAPATHSLVTDERKIFVGGLPPSLDSGSLGKFFEERYGSVEDAIVISNQAGNQIQSRGFGFITFKDKQSVSAATGSHYITINSKQVEIKNAVPKCLLLAGIQELLPKKQQEQEYSLVQPQTLSPNEKKTGEGRPEQKSLDNEFVCIEQKTHLAESETHFSSTSDENMPTWVGIFKEWLPRFLQGASKRLRECEWYPLSSLKADFRAACGIELDHVSLGYPKLSDFMRSMPGICHMKVVPVGERGSATHMVLLPRVLMPNELTVQPTFTMPNELAVQSITMNCIDSHLDDNLDGYVDDTNLLEDLSFFSPTNGGPLVSSFLQKSTYYERFTHAGLEANRTNPDSPHSVHPRFLEFLNPDPIFHSRPWLRNPNNKDARAHDGEGTSGGGHGDEEEGEDKQQLQRHVVLEHLAKRRGNASVFFLRDIDFHTDYWACTVQKKCFACNQGKMMWENVPCKHLLWCGNCKLQVEQAAKGFEHKCVMCDAKVVTTKLKPWFNNPQQSCHVPSYDEFPPFDPVLARSPARKKKSPKNN